MGAKDRHGEGGVRRCREQRQGHETDMNSETEGTQEVRWGGERDGDGHAKRFVPCLLSPSPMPFQCPSYSSPAWKPSHWPSWGEEREVPHGRPPATINSRTSGTYRGFGPRIPQSVALGSCLLPDVKIWGLWVVLFISKVISL